MRAHGLASASPRRTRRPRVGGSPALVLIANAKASGLATGAGLMDDALRALRSRGTRVEPVLTQGVDELGDALAGADGRIVLLGGDGTVQALANLPGPIPEFALLPAGRANNIARSLGIPVDLALAATLAVEGRARSLDVIRASADGRSYHAVEGVSVGFHARARVLYRAENSAALAHGVAVGLKTLWKFRPFPVVIESEGESEVVTVSQLFVANLPLYGFGLRVAPAADPADGKLDLVTIATRTRRSLVAMLPRVRAGTHVGLPGVGIRRVRTLVIDPRGASPVVADSTDLGSGAVELRVESGALEVVAP